MIGIGTIFRRRAGSGGPLPPDYAKWVKEHMVFWYDISKPVDVYAENFNDWIKYAGTKCTVTNKSVNITNFGNIGRPSIYIDTSKKFNGITITVDGLLDGQEIAWGYINNPLVRMPKNGTYILEPINSLTETIGFRSINIVGACNITITQLPSGQSIPTNEILKTNPYLQDHSGNNRPLKLNNFLFAAMSGVGGYTDNFNDWHINSKKATVKLESSSSVTIQAITQEHIGVVYKYENGKRTIIKVNITGISEEIKGKFAFGYADVTGNHNIILENGYFEFDTDKYEGIVGWYGFKAMLPINTCNITIEQIPSYPNALVTDGVDDYGQVQNLQQGVKVLFYTCNNFRLSQILYDQRKVGYDKIQSSYFSIFTEANTIAYNARNVDGKTYIDGVLNETTIADNLLGKKTIITIINSSANSERTGKPSFFSTYNNLGYFANLAFYNSFGFDSVPTKQNDGFTEQDLIDYVLENLITK